MPAAADAPVEPDFPASSKAGRSLIVYGALSNAFGIGYRGKIMLVAFVGTHVPLLTLLAWFLAESKLDWDNKLSVILVALVATLAGTAVTLLLLHYLLQPIVSTSQSLRNYLTLRQLPELPTGYTDDAGVLMSDVNAALHKLDSTIRELTFYNRETGLPNRTHFLSAVSRQIESGQLATFSICLVELVNFRQLVSTRGIDGTTTLLRRAGQELECSLEHRGHLSRISDRALGFLIETGDRQAMANSVTRMLATLAELTDPGKVQPLYSAGAACYPSDGKDADELFDNAQLALSEAVAQPGTLTLYSHERRSLIQAHSRLECELALAIERNQFCLHYQPVIDSVHGCVAGAEALIRWMHPEHGLQMPDDFIPLAERSDLIHRIDRWALDEAARQARSWRDQQILPGRIAVNLSARQFSDPHLVQCVHEALEQHGIAGTDLELEVTETSAMADVAHSRAALSAIQALGVTVAIDDFGTGYCSLSYLRNLPFDQLKIDRQFVQQLQLRPERLTICRALVTLAKGLGMEVLAEGVEAEADVAALETLGCTRFQGFHYSPAVPAAEFEQLLGKRWQRAAQPEDALTSA